MRTPFPSPGRHLAFATLAVALLAGPGSGAARTMQVCTGPQNTLPPPAGCFTVDTSVIGDRAFEDYVVTRPGSLYFDLASRRKELAGLSPDTSALFCAVNPAARARATLPTPTFASSRLRIHTQQWTQTDGTVVTADVARLTYVDLRTTDGLVIPEIEIAFNRIRSGWSGQPLAVSFWVTGMAVPPKLHQQWFQVDMATGVFTHPRFVTLPEAERRLVFALFNGLPARFTVAGPGTTDPGPADPPWTLAAILEHAAYFESVVFATPQPRFDPVVTLNCPLTGSYQTCAEEPTVRPFADYLQRYGADYLASGDPAMRVGLLDNLRAWAAADALSVVPGLVFGQPNLGDFLPKYLVQQFLMPTITSWSLLRNDPLVSTADRTLIDGWLDRVVSRFTEPYGGPGNEHMPWNPGYLTLGVRMAWGIVKGNDLAVAEGIERIFMALHQMRPDGSFPREVARGACALNYQGLQTHHLIVLAELAARQGYDAYALHVDGKSLHDAVEFIVDVIDDPAVIAGYAATDATNCNLPPGAPMLMPGVVGDGDTFQAWIEPYLARFPTHPHAERVRQLEVGGVESHRPIHHIYAGANTTCLFAGRKSIPITPPDTAVEYHHAGFDHYFITAIPAEIDAVDGGTVAGWARTGAAFGVFPLSTAGASNVCRFFSASFAPKSSHFYSPFADECAAAGANVDWQFEGEVFAMKLPAANGNCSADTVPLYRLYNEGQSGAPNHRYTTQAGIRSEMIARGFVAEGFGAMGVIGCVSK